LITEVVPIFETSHKFRQPQMHAKMLNINKLKDTKKFTICTLVTNFLEYKEMVDSFKYAGFNKENSDFFYIDNSRRNIEDGFSGLNKFLNLATGKYIIICHQDILIKYDNVDALNQRIDEINALDSNWAVLGNAGFSGFTKEYYRISDPWGDNTKIGQLPALVNSLDENFLLIKNEANLALSHNLNGFHLYGTDLCAIASILGWNAYVIDFHLYHKSGGNYDENFSNARKMFIKKYANIISWFYIFRTTCTKMIITHSYFLNRLLNRNFFYILLKSLEKNKRSSFQ